MKKRAKLCLSAILVLASHSALGSEVYSATEGLSPGTLANGVGISSINQGTDDDLSFAEPSEIRTARVSGELPFPLAAEIPTRVPPARVPTTPPLSEDQALDQLEQDLLHLKKEPPLAQAQKRVARTASLPTNSKPEKREVPQTNVEKISFDVIPNDQKESFLQRIRLVQDILARTNRVYDYRSTTLAELKQIIEQNIPTNLAH